jgi:hypothetical protein
MSAVKSKSNFDRERYNNAMRESGYTKVNVGTPYESGYVRPIKDDRGDIIGYGKVDKSDQFVALMRSGGVDYR